MKLSSPIFVLKSQAKELKRVRSISMAEALNLIAQREGFSSWSLLQAKSADLLPKKQHEILSYLNPGDLLLIGARPGQGKTTFALRLLLQALSEGRSCFYFTLEYSRREVASRVAELDEKIGENCSLLKFDFSDEISSPYIIEKTKGLLAPNSLIVVDFLQLLDQKRSKPELQEQVAELKRYAKEQKCLVIFLSQIDRSFESSGRKIPGMVDVRLPNSLDLGLFNKALFLHQGKAEFEKPVRIALG